MLKIWPFFISICLFACTAEKVKQQNIIDVNGYKMNVRDFAEELTDRLQGKDIAIIKNTESFQSVKNEIIIEHIQFSIIQGYAAQNNIRVEKEALDKEILSYRSNYPDDISFRAALAEESIAFSRWREKIARTLLKKKVFQAVSSGYEEPEESELKEYYAQNRKRFYNNTQYKVKQIVLAKSIDAENLYKLINKRGSFEKLAKEYSIGAEAANGGLLGWVEKGVSEIFDSAAKLPVRRVSKPIKSDFGYHIVMVDDRRRAHYKKYSEVKEKIRQEFIEERRQKIYDAWFEEQKKQAKLLINEELLSSMTIDIKK